MKAPLSEEWTALKNDYDESFLPKKSKKIKFLADHNIPIELVGELKKNRFSIVTVAEIGLAGHPDENIRQEAKRQNRVLLTTDKDFWDEKKHPIQKCFGIICLESGPQEYEKLLKSLAWFYDCFARGYPLDWWGNLKAFLKSRSFFLRELTHDGKIEEDEYKFIDGVMYMRKVR